MMGKLVPKLRFKEFSGEWEEKKLGEVYRFIPTKSFSRDKLNYQSGKAKNIHYGDIHTKFSTLFDITKETVPYINQSVDITKIKKDYYCVEGDIVFADASEDLDDIGKSIELINLNNESLLAGLHTLLARQREEKLIKGFSGYLFKSNFIRNQIKREAQGAKVLGLSVRRLENITISFPKSPKEQEKITNTLSSLDSLIEAQQRKVEALKNHKKGLMQQLFPSDGENEPKLRFKEFSGEWEEKKLGDIVDIFKGKGISKNDISENGKLDCIRYGELYTEYREIIKNVKSKTNLNQNNLVLSKKNDVIIPSSGETNIDIATAHCILKDNIALGGDLNILRGQENGIFLAYYLSNAKKNEIAKLAQGIAVVHLYSSQLRKLTLQLPTPKEQQKIANTLSSLDSLIEAYQSKVEALKKHKKGLMQQMFVSGEG